jgi:C-terminal processing protease CtpA/Prc
LVSVHYVSYPAARGEVTSALCGGKWLKASPVWNPPEKERVDAIRKLSSSERDEPLLKLLQPAIAYLRLPSFSKRNVETLRKVQPTWPRPTGKEKVLMVDLRYNEGGDMALEALENWVDSSRLQPALGFSRVLTASCLYPAFRWGYTQITTLGIKPPISETLRSQLQEKIDDLLKPSPPGCPRVVEKTQSKWSYRDHRFNRKTPRNMMRLVVLADNLCASDCEGMAYVLASLPETVIAGSNTFGVAQFIQPGYSVLPHTKLSFRIALGSSDIYGDNRAFDGHGLDVDILLPAKQDLEPDSLLRLAQSLSPP